jgi:hypothetical protein
MKHVFVVSALVLAMGCGPVDSGNGSTGAPGSPDAGPSGASGPTVGITSPPEGASLAFDDEHNEDHFFLDVAVNLQDVRIAADCGADTSCGVLALFVDDDACGNPNASASQGNGARVDFAGCGRNVDGAHRLRADVLRGSTLVARSPEVHVTVSRNGGDDHGDNGDDRGGD